MVDEVGDLRSLCPWIGICQFVAKIQLHVVMFLYADNRHALKLDTGTSQTASYANWFSLNDRFFSGIIIRICVQGS